MIVYGRAPQLCLESGHRVQWWTYVQVVNTNKIFDKGDSYHAALGRPSFKTSTTTEKSAKAI